MKLSDIRILIEDGEGFELEFKRKVSSPQKIAKTISSFANTKGGIILFGIDDDGSIVGIDSEKTELELIHTAGELYCDPPVNGEIKIVPYKHRDIIVLAIEESKNKPHYVVDDDGEAKVFIRVNDNTVLASKEVIKVLRDEHPDKTPLILTIGENEKQLFSYLDTNTRITVSEYAKFINVSYRRASRILTTLVRAGVIHIHTLEKTDYFTSAGPDRESVHNQIKQYHRQQQH